jgi:hypothetical protein
MDYYCKACGTEVFVSADGVVQRNCDHANVTIVAERTCNLYGQGGAAEASLIDRARVALRRLIAAFS